MKCNDSLKILRVAIDGKLKEKIKMYNGIIRLTHTTRLLHSMLHCSI